jgi:SAM-dependent methyltransferase
MLEASVATILDGLEPGAKVLDVGGWYIPFNRADHVVDLMPYESRGQGLGPDPERFGPDNWTQLDVCRDPLPFDDHSFDFVICSHTLEDIRDPLFLCEELNRVAKAGYIETPSMAAELTFGIESKRYAGWYHHRWLVEMQGGRIKFRHKPHLVHGDWRYHLPKRMARLMTDEERVTWMLWEGSFSFEELIELDMQTVKDDLERFVRKSGCRHDWRYDLIPIEDGVRRARSVAGGTARALAALARR